MALKRSEINPLGILNARKVSFIPEHFTTINVHVVTNIAKIEQWIDYNLNSRYAIVKKFTLDKNQKIISVFEIGIEDPREVAMLSLGCPYIHS